MAITDYASLVAAVARHVDRDDFTDEDNERFVQMAEEYLETRLRVLDMEIATTEVVTAETATFTLPDDALSIRSIHIQGNPDENIPDLPLAAISPAAMAEQFTGIAGIPSAYSRSGEIVTLSSPPAEETTLAIIYLARFEPLAADTSNWIIERHPNLYFYGALEQAYLFDKDEARAAESGARFRAAVEALVQARNGDRWGPGMAVPSPVVQVPGARC